ncbi:MAG: hypothetical protein SGARI_006799, partial [Bacillariaceae sp.]
STALNSHFSVISTKLYNKDQLLKALGELGIQNVQKSSSADSKIAARGYQGQTIQADVVIPQANDYDIAFCYNGETYELQADLQFWQQSMPVDAFMEKVQQCYAINTLIDTSSADGFQVEKVSQTVDGSVTLELSRFNTGGF